MKTNQKHHWIHPSSTVIYACTALLFLLFSLTAHASGTVVQNGGFETGSFSSWIQSGNTGATGVNSGVYAHSGTYGAVLGPVGSLGYLSQTLTTVPGQIYRLSFWLYSSGGSTTEFNVAWNGSTLMDLNNPPAAGWSNYVFTVTATSSSTTLQFGFRNDPSFFWLDDIGVTPVGVGLTFDDLVSYTLVPNGYGGLNWNNFETLDGVNYGGNPSGYEAGVVSTNNVVFNNGGSQASITNANTFNLYSAYLTAAWYDNLQVEVKGYSGATLIYDNTYTLSATSRMLINFNYLAVTEVDFIASGGTPHPGYSGGGTFFAMDNVNATTGPGVQSNPQIAVPLPGPLLGQSAYVRSLSAGEPWGGLDNIVAMNWVFGSNCWQSLYYETVNPAALFSPARHCVFLEGSDENATALANFLSANLSAIQTWVGNGGSLFVNAAPNVGGNINFGFGVTLTYPAPSAYAVAVNPLNPIFNGPFLPVGTNWSGDNFAHATVSGAGLIPVIVNSNNTSAIILGEKQAGLGHVLFGGMTIPYFHSPQPQGSNLLVNVLAYMDNCPQITFDDLTETTDGLPVTNGYRGLSWNNFYEIDGINYGGNPSGYQAGTVSTNNVAYNAFGTTASISNATPFNFVSAEMTGAWNDNLQVEAQGYVHGILAYDQTYTLSATAPTLIVFNYLGVTAVNFIPSGGTPHLAYGDIGGTWFAMDNVTVTPAPAPLLGIAHGAGSTAVVSWSAPATRWSLQQETSLTGTWASPTNLVNDGGTNKFIIVNPSGSRFYRLVFQ